MKNHLPILLTLVGLLVGLSPVQAAEPTAEKTWSRSLDVSVGAVYVSKNDLKVPQWGYAPLLTYNYALSEDYALGITLLKFSHFVADNNNPNFYSFAYGFQFTHWLPKKWADLGAWKPWLAYSILLNQAIQEGTAGRGLAHDTRLAGGTDFTVSDHLRLYAELVWDMSSFAAFGANDSKYTSETAGLGLRLMF